MAERLGCLPLACVQAGAHITANRITVAAYDALFIADARQFMGKGAPKGRHDALDATYPGFDFEAKAAMMMERVTTHGVRRAAEMREVARTVEELGFSGGKSAAAAEWQQTVGDLKERAGTGDYGESADRRLDRLFPSA